MTGSPLWTLSIVTTGGEEGIGFEFAKNGGTSSLSGAQEELWEVPELQ